MLLVETEGVLNTLLNEKIAYSKIYEDETATVYIKQ